MVTDNLFIFPHAVKREFENETLRLDANGSVLTFFHNDAEVVIDTDLLRDGSSSVVMANNLTGTTYALYNFREILQVMDMTPSELLETMNQRCFMQIDKSGGEVFIKVFLLDGMNELPSNTHDFSGKAHYTTDYIHELDWKYSWTIKNVSASVSGSAKTITISFETVVSDFWKEPIYISHAGQSVLCHEGKNVVVFQYNDHENAYFGAPNCRYKGRAIDLKRLIGGMKNGL